MLLKHSLAWLAKLHSEQLESSLLELLHDGTDKCSLYAIWLDHDVGPLFRWSGRRTFLVFLAFLFILSFASFLTFLPSVLLGGLLCSDLVLGEKDLVS